MTDAQFLRTFLMREKAWLTVLEQLREAHTLSLGKVTTPPVWTSGVTLGSCSWLGFLWQKEWVWFGYGLYEEAWLPMIEAAANSPHWAACGGLHTSLPAQWKNTALGPKNSIRLWAPAELDSDIAAQSIWFRERTHELHEFSVGV